jgi:outer membrane protein assembly factor BamE (lipoprotein component of BamABCDE complex)
MTTRPWQVAATVATLLALSSACTTARITATSRSSVEQRLLVRSLERAAARLDTRPLLGRPVRIEMFGLTPDYVFARDFFRARLETRGVRVTADADVTVQVFATALAVDTADTLLGIPSMQVPVLAVPIPEIALFKWERSRGHAEVQLYTYDANGQLISRLPDSLGEATYHRFTVLIFVSFSVSDLDEVPADP